MSIASELTALNGYILGAYDEINDKGGTVPANKNMANLASAISSIETGGGGTPLVSCGTITASANGVINVEHGLGQRPTIWGIRRAHKGGVAGVYSNYEAVQKIRYCEQDATTSVVFQLDIKSTRNMTSWNASYTGTVATSLSVSSCYPNTETPFTTSDAYAFPVNNKYIGMHFRTSSSTDAFLKTGVEYFWFALVTSTTP
ncbi:MAG: hypothetical protein U0L52_01880 [Bacteroidaceae bacterium]|nr:hypothetical protein [Bacteroidaceae bacterium]